MEKKALSAKPAKRTAKKSALPRAKKSATDQPQAPAVKTASKSGASRPRSGKGAKPCKVESCKRAYRAKGYCGTHYRQWRHGKFSKSRHTRCHDFGCNKPMAMNRMGYCEDHYQNFYVKGLEKTHVPVAEKPKTEKSPDKAA